MLKGIDLSGYQNQTPAGLDFYIIKASEGNGWQDPLLNAHFNAVKAMGKNFGFYHYARPDLGNTPQAEAQWFLSLVGQHAKNCVFALDWEGNSLNYPASWALEWLEYVYKKTGVRPLFYCSTAFVNSGKYAPIAKANFGLWLAQYASAPTLDENSGWNTWAIWQYGDSQPIDGASYDGDLLNGNQQTWNLYCGKTIEEHQPIEKPKPEKAPLVQGEKGSVYRLYNPISGVHFLIDEYSTAKNYYENGWLSEGISFEDGNGEDVMALRALEQSDYIFTKNPAQINDLLSEGWQNQGKAFKACKDGQGVPLYRLFHPNTKSGAHLFTPDLNECNALIKSGWTLEGVPYNVKPHSYNVKYRKD